MDLELETMDNMISGRRMDKMLDDLIGKGFRSSKCTAILKMVVLLIKLLKNKREIECRKQKKALRCCFRRNRKQVLA